ncbi:MAG: hypothetical protein S4CHLAM102_03870 [Chlamydiia bacterium]|nr:hypothetical protein [Chlamydiia bacterium]
MAIPLLSKPQPATNRFHEILLLLGNCFDHYDKALYGLLAPFIAADFFPQLDPITRLICAFFPIGLLFRPLGALILGRLADRVGHKKALSLSLLGMSLTTVSIGLLPNFAAIGILSPCLLIFARGMLRFFSAIEATTASYLILKNKQSDAACLASSAFEVSSVIGSVLAASGVAFLCYFNIAGEYWRYLFLGGAIVGILGYLIRIYSIEEVKPSKAHSEKPQIIPFVAIAIVTGFIVANYQIIFTMLTNLLPLVTQLTRWEVMIFHIALSLFDMALFPIFARLSVRWKKERVMVASLVLIALLATPLFMTLKEPTLIRLVAVRTLLTALGVAFCSCYQYWTHNVLDSNNRITLISFAKALGVQTIGSPSIALSFWLYKSLKSPVVSGVYISCSALLALFALYLLSASGSRLKLRQQAQ